MTGQDHSPDLRIEGNALTFWLRVKPRSSRERMTTNSSGELHLEIHAAATEGQANEACLLFLARQLRVARRDVNIVSGEKSRRKLLRITAASPSDVASRLRDLAAPG